ncbi:MAG: 50S ribosomal protein L4 [Thermodesulfobacteriota bacterium]
MDIDVLNKEGSRVSGLAIDDAVFAGEVKEHLFYEVVKMQLANRRRGNASTKTRSEVSGGGVKPWKQKGTGRARSGSTRSPIWRHGGTVFGPRPRDYSYSVPKKVRREALKSALRLRVKDGAMRVVESLELDEAKTKKALAVLKAMNFDSALIVTGGENKNLELAVRNLKDFKVVRSGGINVFDVLKYKGLLITKEALEKIEAAIK